MINCGVVRKNQHTLTCESKNTVAATIAAMVAYLKKG